MFTFLKILSKTGNFFYPDVLDSFHPDIPLKQNISFTAYFERRT